MQKRKKLLREKFVEMQKNIIQQMEKEMKIFYLK